MLPKESRPKGQRWEVDWYDAQKKRARKRFENKKDAEEYNSEMHRESAGGRGVDYGAARKTTVQGLWSLYVTRLEGMGARGRGPIGEKTLYRYTRQYENHIRPDWEHVPLANIKHDRVEKWLSGLQGRDGRAAGNATRTDVGTLFKRVLDHGVRLGYLADNPATDRLGNADFIPPARREAGKHIPLTMDQLTILADGAGRYRPLVLTAGLCGLRWGELSALTVSDLRHAAGGWELDVTKAYTEVQGRLILKGTKTDNVRTVPVPAKLAALLEGDAKDRAGGDLLFHSPDGRPMRNGNFTKRYYEPARKALAAADSDAPRPTIHDLRHTAVSLAIRAGTNIMVVQRIAGHSKASTTLDVYAREFKDDLHESARRLDEMIPQLS